MNETKQNRPPLFVYFLILIPLSAVAEALIVGDYMEGAPLWYQLPAFVLCIFPVGVMAGLLALRTRSLWPTAFLHAAHNNFDQSIFGVITRGDNRMFYVSETGLLTIVCAWVLAAVMYVRMRNKIQETDT